MTVPAWVKEKRQDTVSRDVDKLREMLARHPGESVHITSGYRSSGWWRVTVAVGSAEAFCPRFKAFDDATSFRLRAREMAHAG